MLISKHVRDTLKVLLSDQTVGFNTTLASICSTYNIKPFTLDFSGKGRNLFEGYYAAKDLIETTAIKSGPIVCLYTSKSQNSNDQKFVTFSGSVMMFIDTYITYSNTTALPNAEDLADAVEATYYTMFNSAANQSFWSDVQYNGDILVTRGPIAQGGNNWIQLMQTRLTFDLLAG